MTKVHELEALVGSEFVSTEPGDLAAVSIDQLPRSLVARRAGVATPTAESVVRPDSVEVVAEVVRWAQSTSTPLVPVGGASGVCGGIAPDGGVVLDLRRLNRIHDLDERSLLVTAEAGVSGPDLSAFLADRDLMLGHEPQSLAISTVGGWLATRACGQLSARFGGIEDLVAGLEAVLPDGTIARWKTAPRRATGPDLANLLIGSEGSLGVITEATLRVSPRPVDRTDVCVSFEQMTDGVKACRAIAQSDLHPTLVRLYDRDDTALFMRHHENPPTDPLLLLSFDGFMHERRADAASDLCGGHVEDSRFVAHWWQHRNDAVEEFGRVMSGEGILGPHGLVDTMEVSGTWSVLRHLYHSLKEALAAHADFVGCHLSHVYPDGACLYFTLASTCGSDEEAAATNEVWWTTGMETCLGAGGSISHHHGIGRLKAPWMERELREWYALLRTIKEALDPNGVMNPGVLGL